MAPTIYQLLVAFWYIGFQSHFTCALLFSNIDIRTLHIEFLPPLTIIPVPNTFPLQWPCICSFPHKYNVCYGVILSTLSSVCWNFFSCFQLLAFLMCLIIFATSLREFYSGNLGIKQQYERLVFRNPLHCLCTNLSL